jgi:hypothetical protein
MKIIISEQQLKRIITEQSSTVVVSGTYTANDCDELHAFQSTKQIINGKQVSKIIGNMNVLVGNKLEELYKGGMNPMVSKVDVSVNGMTVNWSCTIVPSPDGKSWVGFTSRGAGCNDDVINRAESVSRGNDMESAKKRIMTTYTESNIDIQKVNDFIHKGVRTHLDRSSIVIQNLIHSLLLVVKQHLLTNLIIPNNQLSIVNLKTVKLIPQ